MTDRYSRMVREVVIEADQRAGAGAGRRLNKGVALAQLLEREGFSYRPTAVRAWMRGDTKPPPDAFLAVMEKTGISADEVLGVGREPGEVERQVSELAAEVADLRAGVTEIREQIAAIQVQLMDLESSRPAGADIAGEQSASASGRRRSAG